MTSNTLFRLEALQELVNIGGGNAATSLSKLIGKPIRMELPTAGEMSYETVFDTFHSDADSVKAVLITLSEAEQGCFLFVMGKESAADWTRLLFEGAEVSEELQESALKELVNIVVHSFLNAVIVLLGLNIIATVPILIEDMFGSILSSLYMEQHQYEERIIILKTAFFCEGEHIGGSLYFVPGPGVLEKLVQLMSV